jgi:hypothetical protein
MRLRSSLLAMLVVAAGCAAPPAATPPPTAEAPDEPAEQAQTDSAGASPASAEGQALLPDESAEHTIGDTILLSGGEFVGDQATFTVLEAVRLAEPDSSGAPRYAFLVEIEGRDPNTVHYNALQFTVFDDQNFAYEARDGGPQPEINYGDLPHGRKVRGWLTFLGPEESAYLELEFAPIAAMEPAYVRVLLP